MKAEPLRWTLGLAATEFGADRRTLSTRAKTSGLVPGDDGKFSTRQIAAIIYGDMAGEKLRKMRAEADLAELERDTLLKEVAPLALFDQMVARMAAGIRAIIGRSKLTDQEQYDIVEEMGRMILDLGNQEYKLPESQAGKWQQLDIAAYNVK